MNTGINNNAKNNNMSAPPVHIIIVNWNNAPDTIACLESLEKLTFSDAVPVVVDNGSTDGSAAEISGRFPGTRMLKLPENMGFAGGVNAAAEAAIKEGVKYIFLLNNDATVRPDTVANLVSCAEKTDRAGIVGAKVLRADDASRIESEGVSVCLCTGRIKQTGFGAKDRNETAPAVGRDAVHGAAMLVRTETLEDTGLLDEDYFCYFEEIDLCLRAREVGWRVIYCPSAAVLHKGAATFGGAWSARRIYYAARNQLLLVGRHSGTLLLPIRLWWVRMLSRLMLLKAPAEKRKRLKHWLRQAWRDYENAKFGRADYEFNEE